MAKRFESIHLDKAVLFTLLAVVAGSFQSSQAQSTLNDFQGNPVQPSPMTRLNFATTTEAREVISRITDAVGLRINFRIAESEDTDYAYADYEDGERIIAYNPAFMRQVSGNDWISLAILAHEVGHHLQHHLPVEPGVDVIQLELDADHFSGFALARLGATLDEAQEAARRHTDPKPSRTHPPTAQRLEAIEQGWRQGAQVISIKPEQIDELIRRAEAGGTVQLAAGTFNLPEGLVLSNDVELIGAGQEATILRSAANSAIYFTGSGNLAVRNLTLEYVGNSGANVVSIGAGNFDLRNVTIQGSKVVGDFHGVGVRVNGSARGTIRQATIRDNQGDGVYVHGTADLAIYSSLIETNNNGIQAWEQGSLRAEDNTVRDNRRDGILISSTSTAITIDDNTVSDNANVQVQVIGTARPTISANQISGQFGIQVSDDAEPHLIDNDVRTPRNGTGIAFLGNSAGLVQFNEITSNPTKPQSTPEADEWFGSSGILLLDSVNPSIRENEIRYFWSGIFALGDGVNGAGIDNTVADGLYGIMCLRGARVSFEGTKILRNAVGFDNTDGPEYSSGFRGRCSENGSHFSGNTSDYRTYE